jgi:hypothetical protein
MTDKYSTRVFVRYLDGEQEQLDLAPDDAARLVEAYVNQRSEILTVDTDDLRRLHMNPTLLVGVEERIERVYWDLFVGPMTDDLFEQGIVDYDDERRVRKTDDEAFPVAVRIDGLPNRAPAWLLEIRDALARRGVANRLEVEQQAEALAGV